MRLKKCVELVCKKFKCRDLGELNFFRELKCIRQGDSMILAFHYILCKQLSQYLQVSTDLRTLTDNITNYKILKRNLGLRFIPSNNEKLTIIDYCDYDYDWGEKP